ncbi:MAG TPA: hypothetical protein DCP22_07160 [Ruminococcaceae bacterium]|nr:hypothetical protein [Oscillospiraceae bacterium]
MKGLFCTGSKSSFFSASLTDIPESLFAPQGQTGAPVYFSADLIGPLGVGLCGNLPPTNTLKTE